MRIILNVESMVIPFPQGSDKLSEDGLDELDSVVKRLEMMNAMNEKAGQTFFTPRHVVRIEQQPLMKKKARRDEEFEGDFLDTPTPAGRGRRGAFDLFGENLAARMVKCVSPKLDLWSKFIVKRETSQVKKPIGLGIIYPSELYEQEGNVSVEKEEIIADYASEVESDIDSISSDEFSCSSYVLRTYVQPQRQSTMANPDVPSPSPQTESVDALCPITSPDLPKVLPVKEEKTSVEYPRFVTPRKPVNYALWQPIDKPIVKQNRGQDKPHVVRHRLVVINADPISPSSPTEEFSKPVPATESRVYGNIIRPDKMVERESKEDHPRGVQLKDNGPVVKPNNAPWRIPRKPVPNYSVILSTPPREVLKGKKKERFSLDGDYSITFPNAYRVFPELPDFGPLNPNPVISLQDFELKRVLGAGAQGRVYAAQYSGSRRLFAVKVMNKRIRHGMCDLRSTLLEQIVLKQLRGHPFILGLEASFHDTEHFYLVTPYHAGGDLGSVLRKANTFTVDAVRFYAAELTTAIHYLHKNNIIHQDIKPSNVLLKNDGHIVLSDFGLVKAFDYRLVGGNVGWRQVKTQDGKRPIAQSWCGTPCYMAPELISQKQYSFEIDWWSLGVSILEMLVGEVPWANLPMDVMGFLVCEEGIDHWAEILKDRHAKDLVRGLLATGPLFRYAAKDIYDHPFFETINWDEVELQNLTPPYIPEDNADLIFKSNLQREDCIYPGYIPLSGPHPEYTFVGPNLQSSLNDVSADNSIHRCSELLSEAEASPETESPDLIPRPFMLFAPTNASDPRPNESIVKNYRLLPPLLITSPASSRTLFPSQSPGQTLISVDETLEILSPLRQASYLTTGGMSTATSATTCVAESTARHELKKVQSLVRVTGLQNIGSARPSDVPEAIKCRWTWEKDNQTIIKLFNGLASTSKWTFRSLKQLLGDSRLC
ncbi:hypothetical protein AX17_005899 [Amanita inopinata Kibby_2008]|nr:hypothetical protein AX17_005899 [Amanita inopinata Kibby_2008]